MRESRPCPFRREPVAAYGLNGPLRDPVRPRHSHAIHPFVWLVSWVGAMENKPRANMPRRTKESAYKGMA